ncbi:MAG TPA: hypothetical protein VF384_13500 [Planctomycetota bacterium]
MPRVPNRAVLVAGRWRADASGLPNAAAVAVVDGFATASLPLAAVFATALPGCTLHIRPDVVDLIAGVNGTATFQFAMPNSPSLAGIVSITRW